MNKKNSIIFALICLIIVNMLGVIIYIQDNRISEQSLELEKTMSMLDTVILSIAIDKDYDKAIDIMKSSDIIGIGNNNPTNVKGKGWKGQIGQDKHNHAIFEHYSYSLRASAIILKNYQEIHGLHTLRQIFKRYCVSNQEKYAIFVGKRLGLSIDEEFIVLHVMPDLLEAIVIFENGFNPYPKHSFEVFGVLEKDIFNDE